MSQENVELVRHALAVYNAGDADAFVELFTDDCEMETDPRFPEGGTFSGRESIRRFIAGLHQGWQGGSAVTVKEMRAGRRPSAGFLGVARQGPAERHRRVVGLVRAVDVPRRSDRSLALLL